MPSYDGTNYPGPYQLRTFYTTVAATISEAHVATLNFDVVSDPGVSAVFADYDLVTMDSSALDLETFADDLASVMADLLHTSAEIYRQEVWKGDGQSFNFAYQTARDLTVSGTSVVTAQVYGQAIWSFRSSLGGHGFFNIMQGVVAAGAKVAYGAASTQQKALFDLISAANTPCLGRDGGYLFSNLFFLPGQNEAYFKKYNR